MESQTYFRSLDAHTHTNHILGSFGREQWHQWSDRWIPTSYDFLLVRHVSRKAPKQVKTQVRGICQFDRTLQRPPHPLTIHSPNPLGVRVLTGAVSLFGLPGLQPNRVSSHFCRWTGVLLFQAPCVLSQKLSIEQSPSFERSLSQFLPIQIPKEMHRACS